MAIRSYLVELGIPCAVMNLTRHRRARADQLYHPESVLQVIRLLRDLSYDIIHLHHGGDLSWRLLGLYCLCTLLSEKKTVLTFHSGGYASSKRGSAASRWRLQGLVFRRLDRIIVVNEEMRSMFIKFGVSPTRIRLIPPYAFKEPPADRSLPAPMRDFFESHSPLLLTVGLLEPEYDLALQIEILGRIRERHTGAGLVIIGSGSLHRELRTLRQGKAYAEHILLCGDVPHQDTLCAMRECDALLRTTLYDGDAVSVREALFMGVPVIATDNGMRPPGVRCVQVSDPDALEQAIEKLLSTPRDRDPQGDSGRENLDAVVSLYKELSNTPEQHF